MPEDRCPWDDSEPEMHDTLPTGPPDDMVTPPEIPPEPRIPIILDDPWV
jgi:hypothetical protein